MVYQVNISLKATTLTHKEEIIEIRSSMSVTAKIVYEKESYLEWILDQLNFNK